MFTTNTTLSSLIGLTYLDDRVRADFTAPAAAGFALAIAVAHYAALARRAGSPTPAECNHAAT